MTIKEFSDEFDVLLSNLITNQNGGVNLFSVDEYEKSKYLTEAQEELILSLYNGRNKLEISFESSEEARRSLDFIIKTENLVTSTTPPIGLTSKSEFFDLPKDLWFITFEYLTYLEVIGCDTHITEIVPITQDEFHRIYKNPFKSITDKRALRLDCGNNMIEVIAAYPIKNYTIRYVRKLNPIILTDLTSSGLSINNISTISNSEAPDFLHRTILNLAVNKALQSKTLGTSNK